MTVTGKELDTSPNNAGLAQQSSCCGPVLAVNQLTVGYGEHKVLETIDLAVGSGEFVGILGPNGAGKTTLINTVNGLLEPLAGTVQLAGRELEAFSAKEVARRIATVPQQTSVDFAFSVWDVVLMGRYPHAGFLGTETRRDREVVEAVLEQTETTALADRLFNELSGGEQQRVILARALAQEPELLLLDEPTAHLDISYQIEILDLLSDINAQQELSVVMALHDLNLASLYCNRLVLLRDGRVCCRGTPDEVVKPHIIEEVYGSRVLVFRHPKSGRPQIMLQSAVSD